MEYISNVIHDCKKETIISHLWSAGGAGGDDEMLPAGTSQQWLANLYVKFSFKFFRQSCNAYQLITTNVN